MSSVKINRARKLSQTAKFPRTFDSILKSIPDQFIAESTSKQIAATIDIAFNASQRGYEIGLTNAA